MQGKLIVTEDGRDRIHEIHDAITVIGRGRDADLVLRGDDVSRAHCEIRRSEEGFRLVDLESLQGTQVNGRNINQHALKNGDTIRVGSARLTFLGASAAEPPAPVKAPAVLTELPTDEEGQPRRYYRHEARERGLGTWPKLAVILACLGIVAVFITTIADNEPFEEERARYQRALSLMESDEERDLERAVEILEALPPGAVHERLVNENLERLESMLYELRYQEQLEEATRRHQIIVLFVENNPERAREHLETQIPRFKESFPDAVRLHGDLEARLAALGGTPRGEPTEDAREAWEARRVKIGVALREKRFRRAFEILSEVGEDEALSAAAGKDLEIQRDILTSAYETWFQSEVDRALDAQAAGNRRHARTILEGLAAIPVAPFQEQARAYLARLDD